MAIAEAFSGTETVGTTEHSMTTDTSGPDTDTTDGIFQALVELHNLAAADVFEFRCYEKVLSGSTQRLAFSTRFADAQGAPVWVSPSLILMHGWDMTLKKIAGTDREINWSIRRVS